MKHYHMFVTDASLSEVIEVRCIMSHGILSFYNGECSYNAFGQNGFDAEVELEYTIRNHRINGWIEVE